MLIGFRGFLYWGFANLHRVDPLKEKTEKSLRLNQKLATSLDLSCRDNLSAISAINSEFVGFPLVLLTV